MVKLLILMILLVFNFNNMGVSDIDYEDIYDINDYEYPYNYINCSDLV